MIACGRGYFEIAKYLVESWRANVDLLDHVMAVTSLYPKLINTSHFLQHGATALMLACELGCFPMVEYLITFANARVDLIDKVRIIISLGSILCGYYHDSF